MSQFYSILPVADMRAAPRFDSEVVSQALFAEKLKIINSADDWLQVQTPDGYFGWVESKAIVEREKPYLGNHTISRLMAHIYLKCDIKQSPLLTIPYGVSILAEDVDHRWLKVFLPDGREGYLLRGDVDEDPSDLVSLSKRFLGLPYTWGGRSSLGFDCSGFVQMLYSQRGILLPRDAKDQIQDSRLMAVDQVKIGDLIFFGLSEKEITHVGMAIGNGEFIHSSVQENKPFLRISKLTDPHWVGQYSTARRFIQSSI